MARNTAQGMFDHHLRELDVLYEGRLWLPLLGGIILVVSSRPSHAISFIILTPACLYNWCEISIFTTHLVPYPTEAELHALLDMSWLPRDLFPYVASPPHLRYRYLHAAFASPLCGCTFANVRKAKYFRWPVSYIRSFMSG